MYGLLGLFFFALLSSCIWDPLPVPGSSVEEDIGSFIFQVGSVNLHANPTFHFWGVWGLGWEAGWELSPLGPEAPLGGAGARQGAGGAGGEGSRVRANAARVWAWVQQS